MHLKLGLVVALSCLVLIFVAQNVDVVQISFLFWSIVLSSAVLILFTVLIGFLLGWFLHGYLLHRKAARATPLR